MGESGTRALSALHLIDMRLFGSVLWDDESDWRSSLLRPRNGWQTNVEADKAVVREAGLTVDVTNVVVIMAYQFAIGLAVFVKKLCICCR